MQAFLRFGNWMCASALFGVALMGLLGSHTVGLIQQSRTEMGASMNLAHALQGADGEDIRQGMRAAGIWQGQAIPEVQPDPGAELAEATSEAGAGETPPAQEVPPAAIAALPRPASPVPTLSEALAAWDGAVLRQVRRALANPAETPAAAPSLQDFFTSGQRLAESGR